MTVELGAVGELIGYGLDPRLTPGRNVRYADLIARYRREPEFEYAVKEVALGQGLNLLDCSPVYGLVLTAQDADSPYHMRLDDYASMTTDERHMNALVFLAVAAAAYPTPEALEAADGPLPSVTVQGIVRLLRRISERIKEQAGEADPPVGEPQLEPLYRLVLRWRDSDTTGDERSNPKVLTGMVRRALKWLVANGLSDEVTSGRQVVVKDTFRMRSRFRLHVLDAVAYVGDAMATVRELATEET
jgi:hypothetical protein